MIDLVSIVLYFLSFSLGVVVPLFTLGSLLIGFVTFGKLKRLSAATSAKTNPTATVTGMKDCPACGELTEVGSACDRCGELVE